MDTWCVTLCNTNHFYSPNFDSEVKISQLNALLNDLCSSFPGVIKKALASSDKDIS